MKEEERLTEHSVLGSPRGSGGIRIIAWLIILVSFAGLFWAARSARRDRDQSQAASITQLAQQYALEVEKLRAAQSSLNDRLSSTVASITAHGTTTPGNQTAMTLADRVALNQVVEGQKQLTTRRAALEGALLNEPAKALAVPLLKKDVDDLLDREKTDVSEIRAEIAQLYTFSEWLLEPLLQVASLYYLELIASDAQNLLSL